MYTEFFQLREMPFSITPDPAYLYMSPRHQEALGHLLYGTGQYGGFVQLTGEVGTGKTTIVRTLLEQKLPDVDVAIIHNPRQNEQEFVQTICDELRVDYPRGNPTLKQLVDALNEHLLRTHAAGRRTVLIIDEAQNLQPAVLEQVRLLTNLETAKEKLLRIMLIGQPELSALLARPELRQLASRITARYHLTPLSAAETREYVEHRLRVAGARAPIFVPQSLALVHKHSQGVPRQINILCDRALLGAYATRALRVTPDIVRRAAREAMGDLPQVFDPNAKTRWRLIESGWAAALLIASALFAYTFWPWRSEAPAEMPTSAIAAPSVAVESEPEAVADELLPVAESASEEASTLLATLPVSSVDDLRRTVQPLSVVLGRMTKLWRAEPVRTPGQSLCEALQGQGLECYRSNGGWQDLQNMDRPAVLTLDLGAAGRQYVLLESLDGTHAVLGTALGPLRLRIDALDTLWTGEFLVLWRRQTHTIRIDRSVVGADIAWLQERLAELDYVAAEPRSTVYSAAIEDGVRRFQADRGLVADGIAGVRTLIELGDDLPDTPKLGTIEP